MLKVIRCGGAVVYINVSKIILLEVDDMSGGTKITLDIGTVYTDEPQESVLTRLLGGPQ